MRGVAVLTTITAVWMVIGGGPSSSQFRLPTVSPRLLLPSVVALIAGTALSFGLLGAPVPALALGLLASAIPVQIVSSRERRRRSELAAMWPDLLAHIRSSVAAGSALPDAYLDAAERIGGPFATDLDAIRRDLMFGGGFRPAMARVRLRFADPIADRVTTTLTIANETGGSRVGEVLAALSASVAGETRLRSAHEAALTEQRWTAGVALGAPWVILALSIATNPQASRAFASAEGSVVVGVGLCATVVGYVLTRRLASLSDPPRMFR